ncbi:hypothetical protein TRVA0_022S00760 [Trichomonascus vanleenenianus]|uniref:Ymd8p n=1 Tax=Trichomonascus vanleenenianus TaxID=2268995 RepID=UPI003ECAD44A
MAADRDRDIELEALIEEEQGRSRQSSPEEVVERFSQFVDLVEESRQKRLVRTAATGVLILAWYAFSITLSLYNKWMFSTDHLNFPFPVFATCLHQVVQWLLALVALYMVNRSTRPRHPDENLPWKEYLSRYVPCAMASAGDIGMGNVSLRTVTLTFYTIVKSSNLAFVLVFSFLFKLEKPTVRLTSIIGVMTIGVIMMVAGETEFKLIGFLLVLGASACSGLRWSLTQILLRHPARNTLERTIDENMPPTSPVIAPHPVRRRSSSMIGDRSAIDHGKGSSLTESNPLVTILFLSPLMGACLFAVSMVLEGPGHIIGSEFWDTDFIFSVFVLVIPGIIAFCMTLTEFLILLEGSVLTLSVAGIFKELVTLVFSSIAFGDTLTLVNCIGLITTLLAIFAYNWYRYTEA